MNLYECPDWAAIERRQDADRFSQMLSEQAESDAAQARMADEFKKLAAAGDADAAAAWAPQVNDYAKPFRQDHGRVLYPKRPATLAECMFEACEYEAPPFGHLMQLVLDAARGLPVQGKAQAMLHQMAEKFAFMNTGN